MQPVQTKDYYKVLGVAESASPDEIKKSYRRLAKKYHPDVTGGDKAKESKFKEISEAYEILGDAKKRSEYDTARKDPFAAFRGGFPGGFPGGGRTRPGGGAAPGGRTRVEINDLNDLFGGMSGGGAAHGKKGSGGISDLFADLFGGGGGGAPEPAARGADVKSRLEIDLPTAALGGSIPVVVDNKHLSVKIPAGVEEGQTVRIAGQGQAGGDLLLELHVRPHERFRRKGDDLEVDVRVPLDHAVLGGKVEAPTLEKPVLITVPPGTSSGGRLRLRGKGARLQKNPEQRGDLYAVVQIDVPRDIPEKARELIAEFARLTRK